MATKTITGNLSIPPDEPIVSGMYPDLATKLYFVDGITEILEQTHSVTASNDYSFTYEDDGQQVRVKLIRISNSLVLATSSIRGILPRSFVDNPLPSVNYTYDAALAILAASGGRYFDLAMEITNGLVLAADDTAIPTNVNHVSGEPVVDEPYRTSQIAIILYSLGYYLEQNADAQNKEDVAFLMQKLIAWLISQKNITSGLYKSGSGTSQYLVDNVLTYFSFKQAGRILNSALYGNSQSLATNIKNHFYNPSNGLFKSAILGSGSYQMEDNLEINMLGAFFLIEEGMDMEAATIVNYIENTFQGVDVLNDVEGYKAKASDSKLWYEGSYAVSILYHKLNDHTKYQSIRKSLNKLLNADGSYRFGVIKNGSLNVLDFKSVGSTAYGYIANSFPEDIFHVTTGATLTGLPVVYYNDEQSNEFTRNNCGIGATGTTVTYTVPAGMFTSTGSTSAANAEALDYLNDHGQAFANANGICHVPDIYFNTLRTGYFKNYGCATNSTGLVLSHSISAATYGSSISQWHAEAKADQRLFSEGQALANQEDICMLNPTVINLAVVKTITTDGADDDVYAYVHGSAAVNTAVSVNYSHSTDGGATWIASGTTIFNGATNSPTQLITTVAAGTPVTFRINSVSPTGSTGTHHQVYDWDGNVPLFSNAIRTFYFIKECTSINASSIVQFTVPANTYESAISINDANAIADRYIALNGQAYANASGECGSLVPVYPNEVQSETFFKEGCESPLIGSSVLYTVPEGTYLSTESVEAANDLALADIAANGQDYANTNGSCILPAGYVRVRLALSYETIYPSDIGTDATDNIYIRAYTSVRQPANTDLAIEYEYLDKLTNITYPGTSTIYLANGLWRGENYFMLDIPHHTMDALRYRPTIISITPSTYGGITYIF